MGHYTISIDLTDLYAVLVVILTCLAAIWVVRRGVELIENRRFKANGYSDDMFK